jgi:hypothetical protein
MNEDEDEDLKLVPSSVHYQPTACYHPSKHAVERVEEEVRAAIRAA